MKIVMVRAKRQFVAIANGIVKGSNCGQREAANNIEKIKSREVEDI